MDKKQTFPLWYGLLGGRVVEALVFGDGTTGAENDLQSATDMTRHMVTHCRMSEVLGLATFDRCPTPTIPVGSALSQPRGCSERSAEAIDAEVRRILDKARERVTRTLTAQRAAPDRLPQVLLECEVIDRTTLDEVMAESVDAPGSRIAAAVADPAIQDLRKRME